jgi:hypothetical protein
MKILMRGFIQQSFLRSLMETFPEHNFHITERAYHPGYPTNPYPENRFPPLTKNVTIIPKIEDLKELSNYDLFIGIFGGKDMIETQTWKIPTIWRTYVPISQNWQYLRESPIVYNAFESERVTLEASKIRQVFAPNIDGPVAYDYLNPNIFKDWNGKNEEAMVVGGRIEQGDEFGKSAYEMISKSIPIRRIKDLSYTDLIKAYQDSRVYIEFTVTHRIITPAISEAMTTGMPVIVNPVGEFKLLVDHGVDGFLPSTPNNAEEIIKYSSLLIKDKVLAENMGRNARAKALMKFSDKQVREAFEKAFYFAFNGKWEK